MGWDRNWLRITRDTMRTSVTRTAPLPVIRTVRSQAQPVATRSNVPTVSATARPPATAARRDIVPEKSPNLSVSKILYILWVLVKALVGSLWSGSCYDWHGIQALVLNTVIIAEDITIV